MESLAQLAQVDMPAALQYGALGLLALVLVGIGLGGYRIFLAIDNRNREREGAERERRDAYEKAEQARRDAREEAERIRQDAREKAYEERQDKYLSTLIKVSATLATLASMMQSHTIQMKEDHAHLQQEHKAMMDECFSRRGIGE